MPLEVRQIGIRMNVGDGGSEAGGRQVAEPGSGVRQELDPTERDSIVGECVEAVLTALRMNSER